MNTTVTVDEENNIHEKPGSQLARVREKKGYSQEYVAGKLHLRVRVIELLEADEYQQMPEPVFVKGYLRAYAKLLGLSPEPLLSMFNSMHTPEKKVEKALWQSRRESNKGERLIRWLTGLVVIAIVVAVGLWWQRNKDIYPIASIKTAENKVTSSKNETEIRLTDLSKMQTIFSSNTSGSQLTLENHGG
ncbi:MULTISPECIES: helix-turn-helix domain-containing protein [unclassified Legionella]|uniref:helix-turn-helix domain-containing protein n=1 Tax=unclassified Legionella TaxID=2622702 RepID=UPI001054D8A1|nr:MULTISPECIES: helix-turn-helix domain-containing protein [unclassified Legionella]MDI9818892.1 helix-turn-helix domain-containing protein [Legionella sp. PL877]